jgi:hypothetical protein
MNLKDKRMLVQMMVQGEKPRLEEAILWSCEEKVELREQVDSVHPEFVPDEAPWSQGEERRETAQGFKGDSMEH